jgi:microcystin-dependent protein
MPSHNHTGLTDWCNQNSSHSHIIYYNNSTAGANQYAQESNSGSVIDGQYSTQSADTNHKHAITSEGGGGAHNNMAPWLCLNFIIKI